ncbi:MAG: YfiR family protein [Acidobacteriota bacterium]
MAISILSKTSRHRQSPLTLRRLASPSQAIVLLLAIALLPTRAVPQTSAASQFDIQAVYLFNFAKFVRWPPAPDSGPVTICVAGDKKYNDILAHVVKGEQIDSRPVLARSIQTPDDEAGCGIVFVSASAKDRLAPLLAATTGKPILTVSDIPGFLDHGGMIQFEVIANRVRFAVNLRPTVPSGISLSSELLKVAVTVTGAPTSGGTQ